MPTIKVTQTFNFGDGFVDTYRDDEVRDVSDACAEYALREGKAVLIEVAELAPEIAEVPEIAAVEEPA